MNAIHDPAGILRAGTRAVLPMIALRFLHGVLAVSASLALSAGDAGAGDTKVPATTGTETAPASPADGKRLLHGVIEGIISFTKWPPDMKQVRLCIIGEGSGANELLKAGALGTIGASQRTIDVQRITHPVDSNPDCQVLYFAARYTSKQRATLNRFVARPFLTIGEGSEFCSDGGMFCVDLDGAAGRFGVNLDAIARSGLRVNPQVLSLGRAKPKAVP